MRMSLIFNYYFFSIIIDGFKCSNWSKIVIVIVIVNIVVELVLVSFNISKKSIGIWLHVQIYAI